MWESGTRRYADTALIYDDDDGYTAAICYHDNTAAEVNFVRSGDPFGSSWDRPVVAATGVNVGDSIDMVMMDDRPVIAFYDTVNTCLKYVVADDTNGACWGEPTVVDNDGSVGMYLSLAVVNERPAMSYYDGGIFVLKYTRMTTKPVYVNWIALEP